MISDFGAKRTHFAHDGAKVVLLELIAVGTKKLEGGLELADLIFAEGRVSRLSSSGGNGSLAVRLQLEAIQVRNEATKQRTRAWMREREDRNFANSK